VRKPADLPGHHHLARRAQRGPVLLREIIDLEATYAGPEAKQAPAVDGEAEERRADDRQRRRRRARRRHHQCRRRGAEEDEDDDDDDNNVSLAAMEAELKPKVSRPSTDRRHLQEAAQAAGPAGRAPLQPPHAVAQPGAPLQEAQGRDRSSR
jgi:hypothetical protein